MPFYRNILKQSWRLTWRNKYLWVFGVFAAFLGNGGELEILFNNLGGDPGQALFPSWQRIASTGVFSWHTYANIGNLLKNDTLNMIIFLLMALLVLACLVFLVWLVIVSQAAIVSNTAAIIKQKNRTLRDGLDAGRLYFWPVLVLNIIIKAVVYILLAAISLPVIFSPAGLSANLFYILALIIAVPVAIILSFIMKYAIAYVIIYKSKTGQALKQSWRLFKGNWLISLEMAVMLFFINLLVGLAVVLAILALAVPFLFLGLIFYYALAAVGSWLIVALAFTSFLLIVVVVGAALAVFQIASWISLFMELDKNRGVSKLARIVNGLIKAN
ncbi:MAG: putative membrane protein [Parcubacteria group bacterium GW2011_GWC2_42_12]|nr:MAG: putative membrane protein [Parcubacteria group bacterium GW2011_GWC2_42_12]